MGRAKLSRTSVCAGFFEYLSRILILGVALFLGACGGGGGGGETSDGGDASGEATPGPGDEENFFPNAIGNTWYYEGAFFDAENLIEEYFLDLIITGTQTIDGQNATVFRTTTPDRSRFPYDQYLHKDRDGVTDLGNDIIEDNLTAAITPYRMVNFPVTAGHVESLTRRNLPYGEDLDGDGIEETFDISLDSRVAGFEALTMSVGSFSRTLKHELKLTITVQASALGSFPVDITQSRWWAPEVGMLKQVIQSPEAEFRDELQARGYRVNGTEQGMSSPALIAAGLAPPNSDTGRPGKPAVASDGTNFLVITRRQVRVQVTSPRGHWAGILIAPDGSVIREIEIGVEQLLGSGDRSALAFGAGNYLMVYNQQIGTGSISTLIGQRITPDGSLLDGPGGLVISNNPVQSPAVASDGGKYLLVYSRYDSAARRSFLYGVFISPDGQLMAPGEFPIAHNGGNQRYAAVVFDGFNYLVVWEDNQRGDEIEGKNIFAARVSPTGTVLDAAGIPISTAPKEQAAPAVVFGGDHFLVAWQDTRDYPLDISSVDRDFDIRAARVTRDGQLLDGPANSGSLLVSETPNHYQRNVSLGYSDSGYLATWALDTFVGLSGTTPGIYVTRVPADGSASGETVRFVSGAPTTGSSVFEWPVMASTPDTSLIAWTSTDEAFGGDKALRITLIFSLP